MTGLGALVPSAIQKVRGVNADGLPTEMVEIVDPGHRSWFSPDGRALIYYSRESDGSLRFWNREGLTPDRRLESQPVTAAVRSDWEEAERIRATAEQHEAEERQAAQQEYEEKRQRLSSEDHTFANVNRLSADDPHQTHTETEAKPQAEAKVPRAESVAPDQSNSGFAVQPQQRILSPSQRGWTQDPLPPVIVPPVYTAN
ncbi:MAG: hypothetical protein ABI680_16450, partial [Chthoniobacteraceae bacterium]